MEVCNISFRGKRLDNGKMWYGDLSHHTTGKVFTKDISKGIHGTFEVDPKTVGQYTGLKDENGKEIYDGDIVAFWLGLGFGYDVKDVHRGVVYYEDGSFRLGDIYSSDGYNELGNVLYEAMNVEGKFYADAICEVVGNIYENPELLEEE